MNKQEMIDCLVMHALQSGAEEAVSDGTRGRRPTRCPNFAKMPEHLLKRELQFRGLIDFDEPEVFEEDDAGDDVYEDDLRALISSSARPSLDNHFFD